MEKLSYDIAAKLASELGYDNEKREVMAYGAISLIQMFVSISFVIIFGLLFHVAVEALIITFSASILRKYSGGVHASSLGICTFIGTLVCVLFAIAIKLFIPLIYIKTLMISSMIVFMWAAIMINKLAPVDTQNKPIKNTKRRMRMKKESLIILCIYLLIVLVNYILYISFEWKAVLVYSTCVVFGAAWQIFTLTKSGHSIVNKVDEFLNIFLNIFLNFVKGARAK